jgi:hypothetical protein
MRTFVSKVGAIIPLAGYAEFSHSAPRDAAKKGFCEIIALGGRIAYIDRIKGRPLPAVSANRKATSC